MSYDLISFDLDGTLVDTAAEIAEAANLALEAHGLARRPVAEITDLIGAGTRELMTRLLARCIVDRPVSAGSVRPEAVLESFDARYAHTTGTSALPYGGCHEALSRLRRAGVRLACTTNKEARHAHRVLAATALEGCFDLVVGGDSLPVKKPHATVLQHVARVLGVDLRRVAHVGDSVIDVQSARNAGAAAWAVPYGYNGGIPIEQADPDLLFQTLGEVATHVLDARRREAASVIESTARRAASEANS